MVQPKICDDGLYFGMSDDEYHGYFALSASGMKFLRVSALDFWYRSVLNPDREDDDTAAKESGRAYDKRIIEGKAAFYKSYAAALDPADHKDALRTNDDLKAKLKELGQPVTGNKKDLIQRLLAANPSLQWKIWDLLEQQHAAQHPGCTFLDPKLIKRIEIAAAMIEKHPHLSKAFVGGMPQVAIFWKDRDTGVPMKAKPDYLKPATIVDLKTFANDRGLPIGKAMGNAVASYRYHLQTRNYLDAIEEAKRFIDSGAVHGKVDKDFLKLLRAQDKPHRFLFVFQQKGVAAAPIARGMYLDPGSQLDIARMEIDALKRVFKQNWEHYGTDPWLDQSEIGTFDHVVDFPAWIND